MISNFEAFKVVCLHGYATDFILSFMVYTDKKKNVYPMNKQATEVLPRRVYI